jgi:hypothetical protein
MIIEGGFRHRAIGLESRSARPDTQRRGTSSIQQDDAVCKIKVVSRRNQGRIKEESKKVL